MSKQTGKKTNKTTAKREKSTNSPKKSKTTLQAVDGRVDHRVPIQLLVDYRSNGNYLFDFCRDLGTGGVFIQTENPLPRGSKIDLTFTLPDSKETLETTGEVIWVQGASPSRPDQAPGMGIQFNSFAAEQRRQLTDFVARYHSAAAEANVSAKKPA